MVYHTTYHGLEKWFTHLFEKLGWMILAVHNNHILKAEAYISSIHMLKEALQERIALTTDEDRLIDLENLLININILQKFVQRHFVFVQKQQAQQQQQQQLLRQQRQLKQLKQQQQLIQRRQQLPQRIQQKIEQAIQQQQDFLGP